MKRVVAPILALALSALFGAAALAEDIGSILEVVNCRQYITLRAEPDTEADALARMPLYAEADLVGWADDGFLLVSYDGQLGYALQRYLEPVETFEGKPLDVSSKQRYNFNLFLSNFTEASFLWPSGCYDAANPDTALMTEFAIQHCWFNRPNRLEWGDYAYDNNVRLPEGQIAPIVKKYFGVSIKPAHNLEYIDYRDGYYYWEETGGHINDGFACLTAVERLDDNRYSVWFNIYGAGEDWNNDVCYYTARQAASKYPLYGAEIHRGHAVIDTGDSGTGDRSDWSLERITINRGW